MKSGNYKKKEEQQQW